MRRFRAQKGRPHYAPDMLLKVWGETGTGKELVAEQIALLLRGKTKRCADALNQDHCDEELDLPFYK